jgi:hypothetical protein
MWCFSQVERRGVKAVEPGCVGFVTGKAVDVLQGGAAVGTEQGGQAQGMGLRGWQRLGFFPAGIAVMPLAAPWQVHQVSGMEFPTAVTAAQNFGHAVLW